MLLGGPGGSFGSPTEFAVGDDPRSVAVGDFNDDADPDLAVANLFSDDVSVLLGGPGGSFGGATNLGVGESPYDVAVGDFDGDADSDLVVAHLAIPGVVTVLLNTTGEGLAPTVTIAPGGACGSDDRSGDQPDRL